MTYAVYGNNNYKYGNVTRYYGDGSAANNNTLWAIEVDWTNSGVYDGSNEAAHAVYLMTERGELNRWRLNENGVPIGIQPPMVGTATITLDNSDGRYTNSNISSPLYGNVVPGRFIKINAYYHGVAYDIFHGNIKSITLDRGDNPTATLFCEDGMRLLYDKDTQIDVTTDVDYDAAISSILTDIGWPSRFGSNFTGFYINYFFASPPYNVTSSFTIPYFWAKGRAIDEIQKIADADGGRFFCDADGTFKYCRGIQNGNTYPYGADASYTITDANTLKTLNMPENQDEIRTAARLYVNPLTVHTSVDLWSLTQAAPVVAGETFHFWGVFNYNNLECQGTNIITPVSTTDYTANAAEDGSGADMTASISVTYTLFGNTVKYSVTNNHATDTAYITLAKIRGDALVAEQRYYVDTANTSNDAYTTYGEKLIKVDSPFAQTYQKQLQQYWAFEQLLTDAKTFDFQIQGRNDLQFRFDLYNGFPFDFDTFGISQTSTEYLLITQNQYSYIYIKHEWLNSNGQDVLSTFRCQKVEDFN